ncbi:sensor histidine kinase [Desulfococcus sp.]|uniref:sensor histidine kinase n=1 Tax=Desulfococcus sp. TaxID=2025834 RepID=UPI0035934DDA
MEDKNKLSSPKPPPNDQSMGFGSPIRLLLTIAISIFSVEAFNMVVLNLLRPLPLAVEVIGDALILVLLIFPALYNFSYKPLLRHIENRKKAEAALRQSEKLLRRLSNKLLSAHEDERRSVANDLHNELAPKISALKFRVEAAMQVINGQTEPEMDGQCRMIVQMFQELHKDIRILSKNLSPLMIDELGLLPAMEALCDNTRDMSPDISLETEIDVRESDLPHHLKIIIYRVVQEALKNISRHSQATGSRVSLHKINGRLHLEITDNGMGFAVEDKLYTESGDPGIGLASMRERVTSSCGTFSIDSDRNTGTTITATWQEDEGCR